MQTDPTRSQFESYSRAFDYFNRSLFAGELPRCLLNFSRKAKTMGFFAPLRWAAESGRTHEISLNPDVLNLPLKETMATLVHEMCHLWQQEFGRPSRTGYHNYEWSYKMEAIGLMPSSTGKPGGKRVGQKMSDYPIVGGPFEVAFDAMPAECRLPWLSAGLDEGGKKPKKRNKLKYTCPGCGANVWGKPDLQIQCNVCLEDFASAEEEASAEEPDRQTV